MSQIFLRERNLSRFFKDSPIHPADPRHHQPWPHQVTESLNVAESTVRHVVRRDSNYKSYTMRIGQFILCKTQENHVIWLNCQYFTYLFWFEFPRLFCLRLFWEGDQPVAAQRFSEDHHRYYEQEPFDLSMHLLLKLQVGHPPSWGWIPLITFFIFLT